MKFTCCIGGKDVHHTNMVGNFPVGSVPFQSACEPVSRWGTASIQPLIGLLPTIITLKH
jgi:hypothetical protein